MTDSSWAPVSSGVYRRRMGVFEQHMADYMSPKIWGGRENFIISLTTSFTASKKLMSKGDIVQLLENAWKALRFFYPHLAAVREGNDKVYTVPDEKQLAQWLKDTFVIVNEASTRPEHLFKDLDPEPSLPVLYYFPHSSELMFRCSHWRIDCDGALLTMNKFYDLLAQQSPIEWGKEVQNLLPSFFEHLQLPAEPPADVQQYIAKMFGDFAQCLPTAGYAIKSDGFNKPGRTSTAFMSFTREVTENFLAACRQSGHTVTSAVHTAVAWSCYELAPQNLKDFPQVGLILRDQRRQVTAPLHPSDFVLDLGMSAQFITLPKRDESLTYARLGAIMIQKYKSEFDSALHMRASDEISKACLAMVSQPMPADIPPPTSPWLSSIGVIEQFLRREHRASDNTAQEAEATVCEVKLLVDVPGPQLTIWLYTWKGQMSMQICYNDAFYEAKDATAILFKIKETLEHEWGLKFEVDKSI